MRKIERHISNEGSVITFDMFGKLTKLFVADAKYRDCAKWGAYLTDIHNRSKATAPEQSINLFNNCYQYLDDYDLQLKVSKLKYDNSAKINTDILMQYSDTDAAYWCRSLNITNIGKLDLPNAYEVIVILLEAARLDQLDPTSKVYKQYSLQKANTYNNYECQYTNMWSSTECSPYNAVVMNYNGVLKPAYKTYRYSVIPIKEL